MNKDQWFALLMTILATIGIIHTVYSNIYTPYTFEKGVFVCVKLFIYCMLLLFGVIQIFNSSTRV